MIIQTTEFKYCICYCRVLNFFFRGGNDTIEVYLHGKNTKKPLAPTQFGNEIIFVYMRVLETMKYFGLLTLYDTYHTEFVKL